MVLYMPLGSRMSDLTVEIGLSNDQSLSKDTAAYGGAVWLINSKHMIFCLWHTSSSDVCLRPPLVRSLVISGRLGLAKVFATIEGLSDQ